MFALTVVFASWDAEEVVLIINLFLPDVDMMPQYGLVGSTEWGEDFSTWISRHAIAYLNTDTSSSGSRWNVRGSPSLAHLIKRSAFDVPHPTTEGKTLWDARTDEGPFAGDNMTVDAKVMSAYVAAKKEMQASDASIHPLGSGSDYTVFLQRLGVRCQLPHLQSYHFHADVVDVTGCKLRRRIWRNADGCCLSLPFSL